MKPCLLFELFGIPYRKLNNFTKSSEIKTNKGAIGGD